MTIPTRRLRARNRGRFCPWRRLWSSPILPEAKLISPDVGDLSTLVMANKPSHGDWLAKERSKVRIKEKLFGIKPPLRIGRFRPLRQIGQGGMGYVLQAYDPDLERLVALKLLLPHHDHEEHFRERVLVEARALARLRHPNVVAVHDIFVSSPKGDRAVDVPAHVDRVDRVVDFPAHVDLVLVEDEGSEEASHPKRKKQIVIVMEFVEGDTLEVWQERRSWREVLAAYIQAAEGLAAAHGLGIVHRDFKPRNAIIGADGRVRVLDFGIARLLTEHPVPMKAPQSSTAVHPMEITQTGVTLCTVPYAAPEQLAGQEITDACDQFSFCVALHTALEGVAPFTGDTRELRLASIRSGCPSLAADKRRVPAWVRAAVRRGLEADPARRHPSMHALLAELRRAHGWHRWELPMVAGGLVLTTALTSYAVHAWTTDDPRLACDGGVVEVARLWGPEKRAEVTARLAGITGPYARDAKAKVMTQLDERFRGWTAAHRATCKAHRTGLLTSALMDQATLCLGRRLDDLRATLSLLDKVDSWNGPWWNGSWWAARLDSTSATLAGIVTANAALPAAEACTESSQLLGEPDLPATPQLRAMVSEARALLSAAAAKRRANGSFGEAGGLLKRARVLATHSQYQPVMAEALLEEGLQSVKAGNRASAVPLLRASMQLALANDLTRLAVEALAWKIYAEATQGTQTGNPNQLLAQLVQNIEFAVPISRSLAGNHFARPLLFTLIGSAYLARKRRTEAEQYFELAHKAIKNVKNVDLELLYIDHGLAITTTDPAKREWHGWRFWSRMTETLGETHPEALQARVMYAVLSADPQTARARIGPACEGYQENHSDLLSQYANCERLHAFLAEELGDREAAAKGYQAVVDAASRTQDEELRLWGRLAAGQLALLRGRPRDAIPELEAVINARGQATAWWELKDALQAELALGTALAALGDRVQAARHLQAAASGYEDIVQHTSTIEYRLRLSRAVRERDAVAGQ